MPEPAFLTYLPDPFAVGDSAFVIMLPDGTIAEIAPTALEAIESPVVSIDASMLIEELVRQSARVPKTLIDVTEAIKLAVGLSKKDGAERAWNPWPRLSAASNDPKIIGKYKKAFQSSSPISTEERLQVLGFAAESLKVLWLDLLSELDGLDEQERFISVEIPAAQIFYRRQSFGISVSPAKVASASEAAKREKYQAYVRVAEQTEVSPTGMNFRNVDRFIQKTDAAYLAFASEFDTIEDYFRMASEFSTFARDFVDLVRADRDLAVLARLSGVDRIFPRYHPHGTVTSRILVSDPYLQQLRRRYRSAISADKGFGLAYMDFRQFEPGVLAGMSADSDLQQAYNSQDLYLALAKSLFGEVEAKASRDLAKKMFLGFCYGMTQEHIATVAAGPDASPDSKTEISAKVEAFFARYRGLTTFKAETEESLLTRGYVDTLMGNRRYRTNSGTLKPSERRWAVSQRIQGTASLIFKKCLIALEGRFGSSALLLPMHDAILMQFPKGEVRAASSEASAIMKSTFRQSFPDLKPKVSIEAFAE